MEGLGSGAGGRERVKTSIRISRLAMLAVLFAIRVCADQVVYDDALQNGWQNYGWTKIDYAATAPVHGGSKSISVTITNAFQAIYLHHTALDANGFTNLSLWLNGGAAGGQKLQINALRNGSAAPPINLPTLSPNTWAHFNFSFTDLGVANANDFDGFWLQDRAGTVHPTFYLDDIVLNAGTTPSQTNSTTITIDATRNRHPISELIYGTAFATAAQVADLNVPLNRSGGNAETRYNWQINAHNRGADFYFESIADSPSTAGAAADSFVAATKQSGAEPMLTVPMIGWAPKVGANRAKLASYSIKKYGPQTGNDAAFFADAGNGISTTNNTPITWNNPLDANLPVDAAFQGRWIQHLTNRWGLSANGGVRYYFLDNEHSLWQSTHRDVHPVGPTMGEIRDRSIEHANVIKDVDPGAIILGPEEWGWSGYLYSGYDQQYGAAHNWSSFPDRAANGNLDYLPWLLDQWRRDDTIHQRRLLDYFTVHFYPQGGEFGNDTGSAMQTRRNRSTRALWDPNYLDETWINAKVQLIPRLRGWVNRYYPETKIGITEYNWGAENHMNGATAQADILGIMGRENLDLATRWTTPATSTPTYNAMKLYRNYDGKKSTFGDTSVFAGGPNPDQVSVFAAVRNLDRALTVILINKQAAISSRAALTLSNFSAQGTVEIWRLTGAGIQQLSNDVVFASHYTCDLPGQTVTLLIFPAATEVRFAAPILSGNEFQFRLLGPAGSDYLLEWSTNLLQWSTYSSNHMTSNSASFFVPANEDSKKFFRARFW
jgi:hypothetical protein